MTPKQILRTHIESMHKRQPKGRQAATLAALAQWHSIEHHRYAVSSHYHEGANRGPDERPPGWRTGEGAVTR